VDPAGQAHRFAPAGGGRGVLVAVTPAGEGGDLAGVNARRASTPRSTVRDQRCQGVDRASPFLGHLLPGHDEHPHRDLGSFARQLPRHTQRAQRRAEHRPGDPRGVEVVALAGAAPVGGRHPGGLDDVATIRLQSHGQDRAERAGALDDDQRSSRADPPGQPVVGS